jgi:hypothetical protein
MERGRGIARRLKTTAGVRPPRVAHLTKDSRQRSCSSRRLGALILLVAAIRLYFSKWRISILNRSGPNQR